VTAARIFALLCLAWTVGAQDAILSDALSLARQGQPEQARALLESGRAAYPADKRFLVELAGLDYLRKDLPSAAWRLRGALRLDPSDPYANELLASILLMQGRLESALVHWNRLNQPVLADVRLLPDAALAPVLRDRSIAASAGQILTLERLRTTAANLERLDVFSAFRFELSPVADGRFSLTVRAVDTINPWKGWTARVLALAAALPYRALALDRPNIGREAINLSTFWRWDPNKVRVSAALAAPWRQDPRYRYRLFVDARDERWNVTRTPLSDVRLRRVEAGADLSIAVTRRLEWTTGARLGRAVFDRGDASPLFADYWSIRARNQLDYELWRSPARSLRVDTRAWVETGSFLRATRSRFLSGTAGVHAVWAPFDREASGIIRAAGSAGRFFGDVPLDQLFVLGMERDNDLWLRGHVATFEGRKGHAPMGHAYTLWQLGLERAVFHLPLVDVSAGPFFDTGRISGSLGSRGWLRDTGIQATVAAAGKLRWVLVYGRDLRGGRGVFYTAVERVTPRAPPR
jgi:hypothetical protein